MFGWNLRIPLRNIFWWNANNALQPKASQIWIEVSRPANWIEEARGNRYVEVQRQNQWIEEAGG